MSHPASRLVTELGEFLRQATDIWQQYQLVGPGQVDSALFDPLDRTAVRLSGLLAVICKADIADKLGIDDGGGVPELADVIETVLRLAKRCACSPQGLSGGTGEVGLIPNKHEHHAFENQLVQLEQAHVRLGRLVGSVSRAV